MTFEDYMKLPMTKEDAKEILQMEIDWDWEKFRREAAKDILAGMVSNPKTIEYGITRDLKVSTALKYADELIAKLKEK